MGFHSDNSYPYGLLVIETPYVRARERKEK